MNNKIVSIENKSLKEFLYNLFYQMCGSITPIFSFVKDELIEHFPELFTTSPNGDIYFRHDVSRQDILNAEEKLFSINAEFTSHLWDLWEQSIRNSPLSFKGDKDEASLRAQDYLSKQFQYLINLGAKEMPSFVIEYIRYGPYRDSLKNSCGFMNRNLDNMNKLGGQHWIKFLEDMQRYSVAMEYMLPVIGKLAQCTLFNKIIIKNDSVFFQKLNAVYLSLTYNNTLYFYSVIDEEKIYFYELLNELIDNNLLDIKKNPALNLLIKN